MSIVIFNSNVWGFINDVIDNQYFAVEIREAGSKYGVNALSKKVAQTFVGSFGSLMFGLIGLTSAGTTQRHIQMSAIIHCNNFKKT